MVLANPINNSEDGSSNHLIAGLSKLSLLWVCMRVYMFFCSLEDTVQDVDSDGQHTLLVHAKTHVQAHTTHTTHTLTLTLTHTYTHTYTDTQTHTDTHTLITCAA